MASTSTSTSADERQWSLSFLTTRGSANASSHHCALIILNQPFSAELLSRLWNASDWHCCADGGANRLHDLLKDGLESRSVTGSTSLGLNDFLPDLIKGDLDSLRPDVKEFYQSKNVPVTEDSDQYSTDLMKCISEVTTWEEAQKERKETRIIILGGLSGRLDQTIHTLHLLHKLRKIRKHIYAVTDDNIGWVLDEGNHIIETDHSVVGKICGLLPVGVESTILTTEGFEWNLTNQESSFSGLVSTSNAVVSTQVRISTSRPIWWCIELNSHT